MELLSSSALRYRGEYPFASRACRRTMPLRFGRMRRRAPATGSECRLHTAHCLSEHSGRLADVAGALDLKQRKLLPNPRDVFRELAEDPGLFGLFEPEPTDETYRRTNRRTAAGRTGGSPPNTASASFRPGVRAGWTLGSKWPVSR
ncbi:hypothetical protein SHIRM173S_07276 [Streptomyces hirsutus]